MNKQEKIIAAILGLLLVGWMFYSKQRIPQRASAGHGDHTVQQAVEQPSSTVTEPAAAVIAPQPEATPEEDKAQPAEPERVVILDNGSISLAVSSYGAVLKSATLARYPSRPGRVGEDNPPVTLDFNEAPGFQVSGVPGLGRYTTFDVDEDADGRSVTLGGELANGLVLKRTIELGDDYQVRVKDIWHNRSTQPLALGESRVSLGAMEHGGSRNDILSVDSLPVMEKAKTKHWDRDKQTKGYMSSVGGGCSRGHSAQGMPDSVELPISGPQQWVAVKSRFFVAGLSSTEPNTGFSIKVLRDITTATYRPRAVSAHLLFGSRVLASDESHERDYLLYVGPKKLSLLQKLDNGMDGVMQFGVFTWFCKLLVPTLNFFHRLIPNYGVAVILLTFLVRIIFWPLTHHSTRSMKKMQEIQPKLKALQAQFKNNPQKLQQETWAVYRENKVNPMSSCLPMLIQIPVFIALFTVLRSAVELRYAPFLWIADLSEPENLFAGVLPMPLNILPILMAGTMALQSYLTPAAGDPQQQKMMMVMMPVMMLFMFYGFPSALSLYWTVSQVLSIVQMLMMRSRGRRDSGEGGVAVLPPETRQQRRQSARNQFNSAPKSI